MHMDDINYQSFLEGDVQGFENLVIEHKDHLIYFIHRYIKNVDYAEDIAQDAFVEVYVHKERYKVGQGFKTYLYTIGRNKAIDFIRKHKNHVLVDEIPDIVDETSLEHTVLKNEDRIRLHQMIQTLKQEYKDVLYLVDFEELSYQQTAEVMNKSISQIKILVFRARKALKKLLERERDSFEE